MPADLTATEDIAVGAGAPLEAAIPPLARGLDWRPWLGALVSAALFGVVLVQLAKAPAGAFAELARLSPGFWLVFILAYLAQPMSEQLIFARLWRLPLSAFGVLLRKAVINEIVFGYSGEVYFYLWARRRTGLENAPFGAIKDVNILSALAGNLATLVMLGLAAATAGRLDVVRYLGPALWSGLAVVALSFAILAFARRVFSLDRQALGFVAAVHGLRLAATTVLTILLWRMALPQVALAAWVMLSAVRLLVARLPFLTNKDLVFANLAFLIVGARAPEALLLGALAVATLALHLAVVGILSLASLAQARRAR